ncbi:MAG: sialate O-acetylesterase [Oscillospiraceae bacterium]|nr:sialate O-acetylesterase [Oscillospiraceae bacterium]
MIMHSFLLIGQSNMGGRGIASEVEPIENERLFVLRNGRWRDMYVPVNADRNTSGTNLAESFADRYAREHNVDVGLIPCADGGSSLDMWQKGGVLYDHACFMAGLAMRSSTIAGVLWHQGESDCADALYPLYEEKLHVILNNFRDDLGLHDVPFLLGGLGDYLKDCPLDQKYKNYIHVNESLKRVAAARERTAFVSAEGLGSNPDLLHFSAPALREFGLRYYDEFIKLEDKSKVFPDKSPAEFAIRTGIEKL